MSKTLADRLEEAAEGIAAEAIERLYAAVQSAIDDPEYIERLNGIIRANVAKLDAMARRSASHTCELCDKLDICVDAESLAWLASLDDGKKLNVMAYLLALRGRQLVQADAERIATRAQAAGAEKVTA